jgi:hypothetical protein
MRLKTLIIAGAIGIGIKSSLSAAVLITTGGSGAAGNASMSFGQDVTFNVTANVPYFYVIIDEAVTPPDGTEDVLTGTGLHYDINGGSPMNLDTWYDNLGFTLGAYTPSDSLMYSTLAGVLHSGDVVTIHAGTITTSTSSASFTVFPSGSYTLFLCDHDGNVISNLGTTAVPEPGACAVLMGGVCGLIAAFRRKLCVS